MTLAAILFNVSLVLSPLQSATAPSQASPPPTTATSSTSTQNQSNQQQTSTPSTTSQSTSPQSTPPQSNPSSSTSAQKPAGVARSTVQRSRNRKKVVPPDCNPTPAAGTSAPGTAPSSGNSAQSGKTSSAAGTGTNQASSKTPAVPTNCPPPKVTIVREGSTPEPSIQVVGGTENSGDTTKYLQSADENLKKLAGRQLDSNQQNIVTQVHHFIDQSKTATAAGDLESARTLAWKAQLLSDELVNPEK
jgi:hypothetical protein